MNFLDEPVVFLLLEPCALAQLLSQQMNEGAAFFFFSHTGLKSVSSHACYLPVLAEGIVDATHIQNIINED